MMNGLDSQILTENQCKENWFAFRRDFVSSLKFTRIQALFLQDLISIVSMGYPEKEPIEDDCDVRLYTLCTTEHMENSMLWSSQSQKQMLKELKHRGYVDVRMEGMPPHRYIWVNRVKIENDLAEHHKQEIENE